MAASDRRARASAWIATTPAEGFPRLESARRVDVAVIGAGITGLTTALLLARSGVRVAVLDRHAVCTGASGNTTAKITSLHTLVYADFEASLGQERAHQYGAANQAALQWIAKTVELEAIECDFERRPASTYTTDRESVPKIEAEVDAAARFGLPGSLTTHLDLPFEIAAAVHFEDQAQFHPRKYCLALARLIEQTGGEVLIGANVTGVESGVPVRLVTERGPVVEADRVVVATLLPFMNKGLFPARAEPMRSYALGVRVKPGAAVEGMYISSDTPTRSVRSHPFDGEGDYLVVSGEGHKTGYDTDTEARYAALERWARDHFPVREVEHRWSAQDYKTIDGAPYAGPITNRDDRVLVATGFRKWGMTNGTASAMIIAGTILDDAPPWAPVFDSTRANPRQSATTFVKAQAEVVGAFVGDRIARRPRQPEDLRPGDGAVMKVDGRAAAVSRDDDGDLSFVSPVCTHLGCYVRWNSAERSWDCPCHGSRFDRDGEVLEGPATRPLEDRSSAAEAGRHASR